MSEPITMIVGLGNPGPKYEQTRHNAGFWFLDALARCLGATFKADAKFKAQVARVTLAGHQCLLMKPLTFMNLSGQAVAAGARYFKIPMQQILVVYDELDLPPGTVKLKLDGGHGGHNGMRDIIAHLGGRGFLRMRIGIGHPGHRDQVTDYVLKRPGRQDEQRILNALDDGLRVIDDLVEGRQAEAMQYLHTLKV